MTVRFVELLGFARILKQTGFIFEGTVRHFVRKILDKADSPTGTGLVPFRCEAAEATPATKSAPVRLT